MNKLTLNNIPLNVYAKINVINCSGNIRRRLLDLGIIQNSKIRAIFKSPSGDPIAYEIRGSIIALRSEDAQKIEINL